MQCFGLGCGVSVHCVCVCVCVCGRVCSFQVLLTARVLKYIALVLDIVFSGHPTLLLFFVMVACPLGMNLIQAWIQDAFLKHKEGTGSPSSEYGRLL